MTTIPRDFWLAVRRDRHRTCFVAGGRLVFGHGADIELWLPYITASAGQSIEIDLGGVTEIDARALGLLLELAYCADAGSTLHFVRASPRVLRLVRIMGLDTVLPFPAPAPPQRDRPGTSRLASTPTCASLPPHRQGRTDGRESDWRDQSIGTSGRASAYWCERRPA